MVTMPSPRKIDQSQLMGEQSMKSEVLLLDEPCSALGPISTARIDELFNELKLDCTVVIVTHNMQQAARVSL